MRAHHAETGNVTMLHAVRRLLLHLGEDIADDLGVLVGVLLGARDVDGDVAELGPGEGVVEVVFEEVVFGEVLEVRVLDEGEVGGGEDADIHGCGGFLVLFIRETRLYGSSGGVSSQKGLAMW